VSSSSSSPFDLISDTQLEQLMLMLQLGCGRSKQTMSKKRQLWFCFLFRVLAVEADLRGLPTPTAPFHAGDVKPFAE
jgi:hypothetical protein